MYENPIDEVVTDENCASALAAVKRNKGEPGIDRMTTRERESHLQAHSGVGADSEIPAAGSDGGRGCGYQRGGHA
jgi:hypothetical protein